MCSRLVCDYIRYIKLKVTWSLKLTLSTMMEKISRDLDLTEILTMF